MLQMMFFFLPSSCCSAKWVSMLCRATGSWQRDGERHNHWRLSTALPLTKAVNITVNRKLAVRGSSRIKRSFSLCCARILFAVIFILFFCFSCFCCLFLTFFSDEAWPARWLCFLFFFGQLFALTHLALSLALWPNSWSLFLYRYLTVCCILLITGGKVGWQRKR